MKELVKSAIERIKTKGEDTWTRYSFWTMAKDVELENGETVQSKVMNIFNSLTGHITDKSNPHNVTKSQIGLGNVNNTSDSQKPVSTNQKKYIDNSVETVSNSLNSHVSNTSIHITPEEREKWNSMTSGGGNTGDGSGISEKYITSGSNAVLNTVTLGGSETAMIYSENDSVMFRIKKDGETQYYDIATIIKAIDTLRTPTLIWSGILNSPEGDTRTTQYIEEIANCNVIMAVVSIGDGLRNVIVTKDAPCEQISFYNTPDYFGSAMVLVNWTSNHLELQPRAIKGWDISTIAVTKLYKIL